MSKFQGVRLGIFGLGLLLGTPLVAVTEHSEIAIGFTRDVHQFRSTLEIPVSDRLQTLKMPPANIRTRIMKSAKDERIEAITIYLPRDEKELEKLTKSLARNGRRRALKKYFVGKMQEAPASDKSKIKVAVDPKILRFVRPGAIADFLSRKHHDVDIDAAALRREPDKVDALRAQIAPFLPKKKVLETLRQIRTKKSFALEDHLLPGFAERWVKRFLVYRGPNCFHAALSFYGSQITRSPLVNVKREKGYHKAMINYDELWRAITRYFYEVDPAKIDLKYGDLMVFFDTPEDRGDRVNFRWIRHTAVYLFGPYTFSKGSKSPNTPYSIKTLSDEWKTWDGYTKNLGVKIFRRNSRIDKSSPPADLTDWLY